MPVDDKRKKKAQEWLDALDIVKKKCKEYGAASDESINKAKELKEQKIVEYTSSQGIDPAEQSKTISDLKNETNALEMRRQRKDRLLEPGDPATVSDDNIHHNLCKIEAMFRELIDYENYSEED